MAKQLSEQELSERTQKQRASYIQRHPETVFCRECGRAITDFSYAERHFGCCNHCYNKNHGIIWLPLDDDGIRWRKVDRDKGTEEIISEESFPTEETEIEVSPLTLKFGKLMIK